MKFTALCLTALSVVISNTIASPNGAPQRDDVCSDMLPRHQGALTQALPAPFELVSSENNIKGGKRLKITIRRTGSDTFKGFLLQARTHNATDESNFEIVGEFFAAQNDQSEFTFRNCASRSHNCVTHANNNYKESVAFEWKAPYDFEGRVYFIATVVQEKTIFWANVRSHLIDVTRSEDEGSNFLNSQLYDGCGQTKTCFGVPENCIKTKNCDYMGSFRINDNGKHEFEVKSPSSAAWVGLGISEDTLMGDDSVIECVYESGIVTAYTSLTRRGEGNYGSDRFRVSQSIITLRESMIENGAIYCLVERESLTEIEAIRFDLTSNNYFILLATGNEVKADSISYHGSTSRVISPKSVSFKGDAYENLATSEDSRLLIILHGSFMSVAWIGLTSIGIITARYFKMLLGDTKVMKKDIWFRIHQLCMMLTLVLTIAAVTLIWIHVGTWRSSWHSIIGIIASALCFWQGFMSIFRPLPTDPARPIFNFMHGSAGKLAHFLAVITLFLATSLQLANLPSWTKFVLVAYIVTYLLFYVVFMNLSLVSDIRKKRDDSDSVSFIGVRQFFFALFGALMIGYTIAVIIAIL